MAESLTSLATASDIYFDAAESAAQQSGASDRRLLLANESVAEVAAVANMPSEQQQLIAPLYDQPDQTLYEDTMKPLTMDEYAESLARVITDPTLPLPLLMGLLGPRGSGKTHLLKAMLWKLKKICSFSCSNLGARVKPSPVRWRYNLCSSRHCQVSFFCYLGMLATLFALLVFGVVAFTIYASFVYTDSLSAAVKNSSTVSTMSVAVTPTTANTSSLVTVQGINIVDVLLQAAPNAGPPATGRSVQKSLVEQEAVMYPLYACGVVVAFCLLVTITCALVYCCSRRSSGDDDGDLWMHLRAILIMLLCETPPPPSSKTLKRQELEIIPVPFNAYEYSGNDMLWAGIVTTLFDQIEKSFGSWKVRFYRMFVTHTVPHVHDEQVATSLLTEPDADGQQHDQPVRAVGRDDADEHHARNSCCSCTSDRSPNDVAVHVHSAKWKRIPYAVLAGNVIALLSLSILIIILFAVKAGTTELAAVEHGIQIAAGALFGITVLTQAQKIWTLISVLWSSQSSKVVKDVFHRSDNPDFSKQLGYMHDVRRQVAKVTDFVKLMERLYRKRFRVLVVVDALDRCELPKVVNIIEAVNVLLSDEDSHFITLLAVDHNSVNQALVGKVMGNSAQYMQQLFQVRFCMPEYCMEDIKLALSRNRPCGTDTRTGGGRALLGSSFIEWPLSNDPEVAATGKARAAVTPPPSACTLMEHADRVRQEESFELKTLTPKETSDLEHLRQKLCRRLTLVAVDELNRSCQLLPLSYKAVRDLRNVVFCTLSMWTRRRVQSTDRNIVQLETQLTPLCRLFTCWIFLVEVWPYRCSWMLHHVGAMEERFLGPGKVAASKHLAETGAFDDMKLSDLYEHVRAFVKALDDWKYWISNDGDPDTFDIAIKQFPLSIMLMKQFLPFTTNLDRGIKKAITDYCNMFGDVACTKCVAVTS